MTNDPAFDFDRFFALVANGRYSILYDLPDVEGAKAAVERIRGAAGVPEQAGRPETLIEHHEWTLRGALMMARARYELAQEEFDQATAEGRSVDTPRLRRQRPDRPRVVPRSWPAEFRPVYDDEFDSPSLLVPPTPETQK